MNKAVAHILKTKLSILPVLSKVAGLVQVSEYTETVYDETGTVPTVLIKRIPVSCDLPADNCKDKSLVPDSSKKGISTLR